MCNGDAIGELTLAETALGNLLGDLLQSLPGAKRLPPTSGQRARKLERIGASDAEVFPSTFHDWISRVEMAVDGRNEIVHAMATDRCIYCGTATRYEHRGSAVDRTPKTARMLAGAIDALTAEGVEIAADVSGRVNLAHQQEATRAAMEAGQPQSPVQVRVGGIVHACVDCEHPSAGRSVTVTTPSALIVLPAGFDASERRGQ